MNRNTILSLLATGLLAGLPVLAAEEKKESKTEAAGKGKTETHPQMKEEPKKEEPKPKEEAKKTPEKPKEKAALGKKAPEPKVTAKAKEMPLLPPAHVRTHSRAVASDGPGQLAQTPLRRPVATQSGRPPVVWERDWAQTPKIEWEGSSPLVQAAQLEQSQAAAVQKVSQDLDEMKRNLAELTEMVKSLTEKQQ